MVYIHHTRDLAVEQFGAPLREWLDVRRVQYAATDRPFVVTFGNGARIFVRACEDIGDVGKFRGDQWDEVFIDEVQEHDETVLSALIDQSIMPSLGDRHGCLSIGGTPPDAGPVGYFYDRFSEASAQSAQGATAWTPWHWDVMANPHYPHAELAELCRARNIGPGHPIYEREFRGRFVADAGLLVYEYQRGRNDVAGPHVGGAEWRYAMGVDLGFSDNDAIVVFGWRRDDGARELHEVWAFQRNHQDVDQLAEIYRQAVQRWKPVVVVGDTGGHGAVKVLKSLESRLGGYPIEPKPSSVNDSVAIMNDDFRSGRLKLDPSGELARDCLRVVWKVTGAKREIGKQYHSDLTEAARYAHAGATHFRSKSPPPPPDVREIRLQRMIARERARRDPFGLR